MRENKTWTRKNISKERFIEKETYRNLSVLEDPDQNRKHELCELQQMQGLPLVTKIKLAKSRIRDWVNYYGLNHVYVSVSGGKDSTVLAHIARQMYPDIKLIYVDTGLEYTELKSFVKNEYKDNVSILHPSQSFKTVIEKWGYPIFGKEIASTVYGARRHLERQLSQISKNSNIYQTYIANRLNFDYAKDICISDDLSKSLQNLIYDNREQNSRLQMLLGNYEHNGKLSRFNKKKYFFMLAAPFEISENCCYVMKKSVAHKESHICNMYAITGEMASESALRTQSWLSHGCNGFDLEDPKSTPLSPWLEEDILLYLKAYNVNYCHEIYGDIVAKNVAGGVSIDWYKQTQLDIFDNNRVSLCTTAVSRTGCLYCGFGIQMERLNNRLFFLYKSNPDKYDYVMRGGEFQDGLWKPDKRGLGFWFCYSWINKYGNMNINLPNIDYYIKQYSTDETKGYVDGVRN